MTHRETSVAVYKKIKEEGLLSRKRFEIYEILFQSGPLTASQIAKRMKGFKSEAVGANVHARLGELRETGCIQELKSVCCPVTGNTVLNWDVTAKLPKKLVKPTRIKCGYCNGFGYLKQERFF